ncbi:hypothetical protein M513_05298 [Trichuris suis]|uniref:Uncharacterized protein n=1 Tax=Trichuris suis TaxID=68888 RepID=A0A085M996_9BILA|nr:hypothetical protein M513_05298 [Trichuris suis]
MVETRKLNCNAQWTGFTRVSFISRSSRRLVPKIGEPEALIQVRVLFISGSIDLLEPTVAKSAMVKHLWSSATVTLRGYPQATEANKIATKLAGRSQTVCECFLSSVRVHCDSLENY